MFGSERRHRATSSSGGAPRILFVSHEATRTGAPVVLLHFLRWLHANSTLSFEVLLLAGGPLEADFAALAPTYLVEVRGTGPISYLEAGVARAGFPRVSARAKSTRARRAVRDRQGYDVLYLNSATSAFALGILPEVPPVVVSHIHELDSAFEHWFAEPDRKAMLRETDWFVACSEGVRRNLVAGYGMASDRVSCHYEFIEPPAQNSSRTIDARRSIGVPDDAMLVGGSGQVIWRKGPDLFLQMADVVRRSDPDLDVHFVWVGGAAHDAMPIESDIRKLGLEGRVHFVGELTSPGDLYAGLDVFCLTSREDPFPLVMLETASLAVPVVSFANGGATEFAGGEDGAARRAIIVPYLDVEEMAAEVSRLLRDHSARVDLGVAGQERVLGRHTVEVAAAALHAELVHRVDATLSVTGSAEPLAPR